MFHTKRKKQLPLKSVYYTSFIFFIVIPILVVLIIALLVLNQQFKRQAIENIKRAQETIITELVSDINNMSMRLSHLIYTNNNEILKYAAGTDTKEWSVRYEYDQKLNEAGNLALEPVKDIVSIGFYMKSGKETFVKNNINRSSDEIKNSKWYQSAIQKPNTVCVGAYDTKSANDLFTGGKKDLLILVFALAPDVTTDRSQKIEMVAFYQSTKAAERIKKYNQNYLSGENKLGITQITNTDGDLIFSTLEDSNIDYKSKEYTCVKSSLEFNNTIWSIDSYVKTSVLTSDYWDNALVILGVAILVLLLSGYYSRYFLRSIVRPIEEISAGLRNVEEGNLEVHVAPSGQFEVRTMIHQFNAMVRRLKALINEYEERVKNVEKNPKDYLAAMIKGEMTPEEVSLKSNEFFMDRYALLGIFVDNYKIEGKEDYALQLTYSFERNPRFTSRCFLYMERNDFFLVFYRITEEDYISRVVKMAEELQKEASKEFGVQLSICIGRETFGPTEFEGQIEEIRRKVCLRHLFGDNAIIDLNDNYKIVNQLLEIEKDYKKLADALYIADEKNMVDEKDRFFAEFNSSTIEKIKIHIYAIILAIENHFYTNNVNFSEVFGQQYNYFDKINRIGDKRNLKLWLTNYFAWIMEYSASKLNVSETDVTVRAKRYIADNYEDANFSLVKVAEYVGLNEKYFTTRFTKETGETFSTYLTGIRLQKSKELLKSTNFKVYEIAEMVGYHNVEHFNRMFKKLNGISPAQYRKTM